MTHADRYFNKKTIRTLSRRGVEILSATYIPGPDGSYLNGETAFNVVDNGVGRVLTFSQVLKEME